MPTPFTDDDSPDARQKRRARFGQQRTRMRKIEVTVSTDCNAGTEPRRLFPTDCYEQAYRYLTTRACPTNGMWLVCGYANLAVPYQHYWVELPDDVVFDGSLQRF